MEFFTPFSARGPVTERRTGQQTALGKSWGFACFQRDFWFRWHSQLDPHRFIVFPGTHGSTVLCLAQLQPGLCMSYNIIILIYLLSLSLTNTHTHTPFPAVTRATLRVDSSSDYGITKRIESNWGHPDGIQLKNMRSSSLSLSPSLSVSLCLSASLSLYPFYCFFLPFVLLLIAICCADWMSEYLLVYSWVHCAQSARIINSNIEPISALWPLPIGIVSMSEM